MRVHGTGERGAGTVTVVGIAAGLVVVLLAVLPFVAVLRAERGAATAADAAALAAADTASGLVAGIPCATAASVAAEDGGVLERCVQRADTVTVTVSMRALGMPISVGARAGPPPRTGAIAP